MGIMLIEEPVENSDDSEFGDFEDSDESLDIGLEEEPGSLLDYLRARRDRLGRSNF